jgi:hypothetical protein
VIKEIFIKGRSYLYEVVKSKTIVYSPYPIIVKKKKYHFFGETIIVKTFKELFTIESVVDEINLKLIIKRKIKIL